MPTNNPEDSEEVQLNVRVPKAAKEEADAKLPHGGLTAAVRERIEEIAYGKPTTEEQELREELRGLRSRQRELRTERDHLNSQLEDLAVDIERLEAELTRLEQDRSP